jgi:hypothetical protein
VISNCKFEFWDLYALEQDSVCPPTYILLAESTDSG